MKEAYEELNLIFSRTKEDIERFHGMLQPVVEHAQDEHERLYFHHILEEEEQRLERLEILLPMLQQAAKGDVSSLQFIQLLQELNLEKFGLHNFREHLDLAMYEFQDEIRQTELKSMRERTQADYLKVKDYLQDLNQKFEKPLSASELMQTSFNSAAETKSHSHKRLTVGSLRKQ